MPAPTASRAPAVPTLPPPRSARLDALRGLAMVWMTGFHFCFDLSHLGWWRQNFYTDPFWTWQRTAIVSLFLLCAGLAHALAHPAGSGWGTRFWRRWAQVAGCALLVTAGSWWMFPQSFIYFGVLHALAVMLLLARLSAGWGRGLWWAGALALVLPILAPWLHAHWAGAGLLDGRALNWLGLVSRKPITEDYVPLLPWLGVLWWGLAVGQWVVRQRSAWLAGPLPVALRPLAGLGRWSLSYYMLHQPVLLGTLMGVAWLLR